MKKIFILLCVPILSFAQDNEKLTKYVAASYYIDIKLGDQWIQIEETEDTIEIYWYSIPGSKKIDVLFPNTNEYKLGKLQDCITLNSCFSPLSFFQSNDNPLVYSNKDINETVILKKDDDSNILSITLEISDQYRIRHNLIFNNKINIEIDDRKGLTKNQFFDNYLEACNESIELNYSNITRNNQLRDYCYCMVARITDKFKHLEFNDEYIREINTIDWNSNESILWMNECSYNYLFKKEAKKIRKNQ